MQKLQNITTCATKLSNKKAQPNENNEYDFSLLVMHIKSIDGRTLSKDKQATRNYRRSNAGRQGGRVI